MNTVTGYPPLQALAEVSDYRKLRGKRHPLLAILALGCVAVLCGASGLTAASQWGREHSRTLLAKLGFTHFPGPSPATLWRVFSQVDVAALEQALTKWWQAWLPGLGPLALDGKTVRGSRQGSQEALQVLAAFDTQVRVVLAQRAISKGDEISTAVALLEGLDITGWIVTGDAKLTQQAVVKQVIAHGGDYVLTAKANQPTLCDDIATLFSVPQVVAETITTTRRSDLHGSRIEVRALQASSALTAEYCGWAGLQQVFRLERQRIDKRTGARTVTVVFDITSRPQPKPMPQWPRMMAAIGASKIACIRCAMSSSARMPAVSAPARRPHSWRSSAMWPSASSVSWATTVRSRDYAISHGTPPRQSNLSPNVLD
jgi:hypothetical protein